MLVNCVRERERERERERGHELRGHCRLDNEITISRYFKEKVTISKINLGLNSGFILLSFLLENKDL